MKDSYNGLFRACFKDTKHGNYQIILYNKDVIERNQSKSQTRPTNKKTGNRNLKFINFF